MIIIKLYINRLLLISDYWIILPAVLILDIIIMRKIYNYHRKRKIEMEFKKLQIYHAASNNSVHSHILRCGDNLPMEIKDGLIEVIEKKCKKRMTLLTNKKLTNFLVTYFKNKSRNGIIYITRSALCYLVTTRKSDIVSRIVTINSVSLMASDSHIFLCRVVLTMLVFGLPLPLAFNAVLSTGMISRVCSLIFAIFSLIFGYKFNNFVDPRGTFLLTGEVITSSLKYLESQSPETMKIVAVDLVPERIEKIKFDCLKPESDNLLERLKNQAKCNWTEKELLKISEHNYEFNLHYDEVVNLCDVTHLDGNFTDKIEIMHPFKTGKKYLRKPAKMVKFLDKFKDPDFLPESEQWEVGLPSIKRLKEDIKALADEGDI